MCNVMIVDGNKLMREALRVLISKREEFLVVGSFATCEEGVEFCTKNKVHMVFTDVFFPELSGIDMSRILQKMDSSLIINIMSAYDNTLIMKEALNCRVHNFIMKPISQKDMNRILDDYLSEQRKDENVINKLNEALKQGQYEQILQIVPEIVEEILSRSLDDEELREHNFFHLVYRIFEICNKKQVTYEEVKQRFWFHHAFYGENIFWTYQVMEVLDEVFRNNLISKHNHLEAVFSYIDEEIKNSTLTLKRICEHCYISQTYLSKLFRNYFGISVMDYIHMRRIMRAKIYISFSDLNLTDIGQHVGYNDGSYFSKVFKKYEGISPKEYKDKISVK